MQKNFESEALVMTEKRGIFSVVQPGVLITLEVDLHQGRRVKYVRVS